MHHISRSRYEFVCFFFSFLLPSFSLLGSALGFFLLEGSFSLTPSGFCSDYRWFYILVRDGDCFGRWWSAMCAPVCASWLSARLQMAQCLIIERSGNTHTNSWPNEHGKWSCSNLQSHVPVTCLDFGDSNNLNSSRAQTLKKYCNVFIWDVTLAETTHAGWRYAAGMLVRHEGSTVGTSAWHRAWTHKVM